MSIWHVCQYSPLSSLFSEVVFPASCKNADAKPKLVLPKVELTPSERRAFFWTRLRFVLRAIFPLYCPRQPAPVCQHVYPLCTCVLKSACRVQFPLLQPPQPFHPCVRHPIAFVCLSVPQSVSLTWLHPSCASMTTRDEGDCGGLISIHNEFFPCSPLYPTSPPPTPSKSGFKSRRQRSAACAAVIVLESWPIPVRASRVTKPQAEGGRRRGSERRAAVAMEGGSKWVWRETKRPRICWQGIIKRRWLLKRVSMCAHIAIQVSLALAAHTCTHAPMQAGRFIIIKATILQDFNHAQCENKVFELVLDRRC